MYLLDCRIVVRKESSVPFQISNTSHLRLGHHGISTHRHLLAYAAALNPDGHRALHLAQKQFSANGHLSAGRHARGFRYTCSGQSANFTQRWFYWLVLLLTPPKVGQVGPPTMGLRGAEGRSRLGCHHSASCHLESTGIKCNIVPVSRIRLG